MIFDPLRKINKRMFENYIVGVFFGFKVPNDLEDVKEEIQQNKGNNRKHYKN